MLRGDGLEAQSSRFTPGATYQGVPGIGDRIILEFSSKPSNKVRST